MGLAPTPIGLTDQSYHYLSYSPLIGRGSRIRTYETWFPGVKVQSLTNLAIPLNIFYSNCCKFSIKYSICCKIYLVLVRVVNSAITTSPPQTECSTFELHPDILKQFYLLLIASLYLTAIVLIYFWRAQKELNLHYVVNSHTFYHWTMNP